MFTRPLVLFKITTRLLNSEFLLPAWPKFQAHTSFPAVNLPATGFVEGGTNMAVAKSVAVDPGIEEEISRGDPGGGPEEGSGSGVEPPPGLQPPKKSVHELAEKRKNGETPGQLGGGEQPRKKSIEEITKRDYGGGAENEPVQVDLTARAVAKVVAVDPSKKEEISRGDPGGGPEEGSGSGFEPPPGPQPPKKSVQEVAEESKDGDTPGQLGGGEQPRKKSIEEITKRDYGGGAENEPVQVDLAARAMAKVVAVDPSRKEEISREDPGGGPEEGSGSDLEPPPGPQPPKKSVQEIAEESKDGDAPGQLGGGGQPRKKSIEEITKRDYGGGAENEPVQFDLAAGSLATDGTPSSPQHFTWAGTVPPTQSLLESLRSARFPVHCVADDICLQQAEAEEVLVCMHGTDRIQTHSLASADARLQAPNG